MTSPRLAAFLDEYDALSDAEKRRYARHPEFAYLMARIKFRDDEPVPFEQLDIALELQVRYPYSLSYDRRRAEEARRRRLTKRLAASVPFRPENPTPTPKGLTRG